KKTSSILIKNGILIPMDPPRRIIEDGAVAIEGNKIIETGKTEELVKKHQSDTVIDATRMVIMPGLMDGHAHAGHSLLRTLGMHNDTWYKACEDIYATGSTTEYWEADAALLNLERLKFGTTCGISFLGGGDSIMRVDDPKYARAHCDAAEKIGVRTFMAVGPRRLPYPSLYSDWSGESRRDLMVDYEEQIAVTEKIIEENHNRASGRVKVAVMHPTPHPEVKPILGQELVDLKERAKTVRDLSRKYDLMFTMDGHSRGTVKFCHEELGFTGPEAVFSHSTDLTAEEIQICKETGTNIAHNPSAVASIMGRCPVPELIDAGVTVVMGSDAGAPDRSFDMFRHMFQCMRYHRRHYRDADVLPPGKILEMTTIDGAKAFRMDDQIGSLEAGKKADLILVDLNKPHFCPLNMYVDKVAYFANGNDVDTVIVDGEVLMRAREVKTVNEQEVLDKAQEQIEAALGRINPTGLFDITKNYWGKSHY
ncbi:MAG: amidohydrolase family protein, partial [Candidatus Bathyarchaeota archaeon]